MKDDELIAYIIKQMGRAGWGATNRDNVHYQVNTILVEYNQMKEQLRKIRKEVMK